MLKLILQDSEIVYDEIATILWLEKIAKRRIALRLSKDFLAPLKSFSPPSLTSGNKGRPRGPEKSFGVSLWDGT